jgi:acyl carrier protein
MEIKNKLQELFRDILDIEDIILEDTTSANDLEEWDSLTHINLVVAIEREFKIRFALGELSDMKNIGDITKLIYQKTNY